MENNNTNDLNGQENEIINSKRILVGILAILLGPIGVHKFVLGYTKTGIIHLLLFIGAIIFTVITCGIGSIVFSILWIITLVEGIIYLLKSDEDFIKTYQEGYKPWF